MQNKLQNADMIRTLTFCIFTIFISALVFAQTNDGTNTIVKQLDDRAIKATDTVSNNTESNNSHQANKGGIKDDLVMDEENIYKQMYLDSKSTIYWIIGTFIGFMAILTAIIIYIFTAQNGKIDTLEKDFALKKEGKQENDTHIQSPIESSDIEPEQDKNKELQKSASLLADSDLASIDENPKERSPIEYIIALGEHKFESAKTIFEEIQSKNEGTNKGINQLQYNFHRFINGQISEDKLILQFINETEDLKLKAHGNLTLGQCYSFTKRYDDAETFYDKCLEYGFEDYNLEANTAKANLLSKQGKTKEALQLLIDLSQSTKDSESKYKYFRELARLYEEYGNDEMRINALENCLDIQPNNTSTLFDLSYCYGERDEYRLLAFHNYHSLLMINKNHSSALNNISIIHEQLELPIARVQSLKRGIELNSDFAIANLSNLLLDNGFIEEAKNYLNNYDDHDSLPRIFTHALGRLVSDSKDEKMKENEFLKEGLKLKLFKQKYSIAIFQPLQISEGTYSTGVSDIQYKVLFEGDILSITWDENDCKQQIKSDSEIKNAGKITYTKVQKTSIPNFSNATGDNVHTSINTSDVSGLFYCDTDTIKMMFLENKKISETMDLKRHNI